MMIKKTWSEFSDSGLLWWVNRSLHIFGWAIVIETDIDTRQITATYPARVEWRGFGMQAETEGFKMLTTFIEQNGADLANNLKKAEKK
jgi:hypothetical protein